MKGEIKKEGWQNTTPPFFTGQIWKVSVKVLSF